MSPHKTEQLRSWDLLQLCTPWLLLATSTAVYFAWALPSTGAEFWPEGATVLGLLAASAAWIAAGSSAPIARHAVRPVPAAIYFLGLLGLCIALMAYSEVFVILTIAGFFHAYLLSPWLLGLVAVFATSTALNGMTLFRPDPTPETFVMLVLIVVVQTAAIGVGIPISRRNETEERKRDELIAQLEQALHENAGLHAQLVNQARESGVQDERERLAREIHDTLAQGFAGIITQLQATQRRASSPIEREEHVSQALRLARTGLTEARRSVQALAPQELGRAQLPEAIRTLTEQWSKQERIPARVEVTGTHAPLSPAIEVALFRVAQESLTNVGKHADATRVGVTLSYVGTEVLLDVRDDGLGYAEATRTGFGLTSMRQRIRGVGGHVEVQSAPGEGTSVSARVPAIAGAASEEAR
ncbi:sensor histidine kinase [Microbacterium sp. dk485]|uniref:Oxygen sensor histidine kinase NreB n=1 Tax=Microbacterium wangchenii TaxID=2541726 RepID=A0ABX5SV22_9MICO|nr:MULTISPECIES: sensor histidine kinase [Microbacterium]MCK6068492.1 sensor histidine kinase [Microbacterium sp. EYE_512]QBR90041.1 sensor histidine kinase [Microbacterium wangchenii]TFV85107.1 sensor histidine kinase [Microbacterium sp. dk485]